MRPPIGKSFKLHREIIRLLEEQKTASNETHDLLEGKLAALSSGFELIAGSSDTIVEKLGNLRTNQQKYFAAQYKHLDDQATHRVTLENVLKAHEAHMRWLQETSEKHVKMQEEHFKAQQEALAAHLNAQKTALAAHLKAQETALVAHLKAQQTALAADLKAQQTALATQLEAQKTAFQEHLKHRAEPITRLQRSADNILVELRSGEQRHTRVLNQKITMALGGASAGFLGLMGHWVATRYTRGLKGTQDNFVWAAAIALLIVYLAFARLHAWFQRSYTDPWARKSVRTGINLLFTMAASCPVVLGAATFTNDRVVKIITGVMGGVCFLVALFAWRGYEFW